MCEHTGANPITYALRGAVLRAARGAERNWHLAPCIESKKPGVIKVPLVDQLPGLMRQPFLGEASDGATLSPSTYMATTRLQPLRAEEHPGSGTPNLAC